MRPDFPLYTLSLNLFRSKGQYRRGFGPGEGPVFKTPCELLLIQQAHEEEPASPSISTSTPNSLETQVPMVPGEQHQKSSQSSQQGKDRHQSNVLEKPEPQTAFSAESSTSSRSNSTSRKRRAVDGEEVVPCKKLCQEPRVFSQTSSSTSSQLCLKHPDYDCAASPCIKDTYYRNILAAHDHNIATSRFTLALPLLELWDEIYCNKGRATFLENGAQQRVQSFVRARIHAKYPDLTQEASRVCAS